MVLAGIQKKPFAGFGEAGPHVGQLVRHQQIASRARDRPQHAVELTQVVEAPFEDGLHRASSWNQAHVASRVLHVGIEPGESSGGYGLLIHDRPEHVVDCLAQFPAPFESLLRALGIGIASLEQPIYLLRFEQPAIFTESDQIHISLQQLFGLGVTVVERIHEVETNVARNQFEAWRTAAVIFFSFFALGQRNFLSPYYLTIKTVLTS